MAVRLYLGEDVRPLIATLLRERGFDCVAAYEAGNRTATDEVQLAYATRERRVILTYNVKDYVNLAKAYAAAGKSHAGILVSTHLNIRELLRRTLLFLHAQGDSDTTNRFFWLHDYNAPAS